MKIPQGAPSLEILFNKVGLQKLPDLILRRVGPAPDGKYRHWDTIRRMSPPDGLSVEDWWLAMKIARSNMRRPISLQDKIGHQFHYTLPDPLLRMLHRIDQETSGAIQIAEPITNPETKDRYVQSSLMEEAITSSQLEGAATTRDVAKEMLRMGRPPSNVSERMILNNFHAMQQIGELKARALTPELVIQLHRLLTDATLPPRDTYLRQAGDGIGVYDNSTNTLLHMPPSAGEIPARMEEMCRFANEEDPDAFLHPVLRSIILHFWLAYDHPFIDGNGRTARALFYWSMLRHGFWLSEYISISTILRKAPAKYGRSFLYTETDENDLTYFILAQLHVICQAVDELQRYLDRKIGEVRRTAELLKQNVELNYRQLALLSHALRHPGKKYTIQSHRTSHRITYQTARTDLLDLESRELLAKHKRRRTFIFEAPADLSERLRRLT